MWIKVWLNFPKLCTVCAYRGADKSLARPTSRCILFDDEKILFDASLVIHTVCIYIYIYIYIQGDSRLVDITAGGDFLGLCDQKS